MTSSKQISTLNREIAQLEQEIENREQRLLSLNSSTTPSGVATLAERLASVRAAVETRPETQALSGEIAVLSEDLQQKQAKLAELVKEVEAQAAAARLEAEIPRLNAISAELNQASEELLAKFRAFELQVKEVEQATGRSHTKASRIGFPRALPLENLNVSEQDFFAVYTQGEVFFASEQQSRYLEGHNSLHWLERKADQFGYIRNRLQTR